MNHQYTVTVHWSNGLVNSTVCITQPRVKISALIFSGQSRSCEAWKIDVNWCKSYLLQICDTCFSILCYSCILTLSYYWLNLTENTSFSTALHLNISRFYWKCILVFTIHASSHSTQKLSPISFYQSFDEYSISN